MRNALTVTSLVAISASVACTPAAPASSPAAASAVSVAPAAAACEVWDREVAFARSVQNHDAHAFAEIVHPGAVFVERDTLHQGRDAVVKSWEDLIRGDAMRLDWHPTSVVLTGDPRVALSRGPYWIEVTKPDAKQRFLTGVFQSVWLKDDAGVWRVAIDGGPAPPPVPATEADVAKIKASLPARCPLAG
jgi:ketosteroid isomerase-like protein